VAVAYLAGSATLTALITAGWGLGNVPVGAVRTRIVPAVFSVPGAGLRFKIAFTLRGGGTPDGRGFRGPCGRAAGAWAGEKVITEHKT